jgi:hypothetical protein
MARIKYQEAAGLEVKRGRTPVGPAPSKAALVKLYVKEERSVRDVAAVLQSGQVSVARQLVLDEGQDLNEFYMMTRGKP